MKHLKTFEELNEASTTKVRYSKDRKSPRDSATWYDVGTEKEGVDGNMWVVQNDKNCDKHWKKVAEEEKDEK